jgi:hypothetical protein
MLLVESNYQTEVLTEGEGSGKNWFINGIFMQADVVNRNRRIYPDAVVNPQVQWYINEYVNTSRALGELDHPDTPKIDLNRASHLITQVNKDGSNYIGKAKILNTPTGNLVKGLLDGGVKLGVSSRGMGSVQADRNGVNVVQPDFKLATVDIVYQPSAPEAFVEGLMENAQFVWGSVHEDVEFVQQLKEKVQETKLVDLREAKIEAFKAFMKKFS